MHDTFFRDRDDELEVALTGHKMHDDDNEEL